MNLVKLITDQFTEETLGKLSGLLGTDSETTSAAATAAVPALLSGLAGMASRGEGAKKLADVLSGVDAGTMGNLAHALGGDTGGLMQRGTGLLGSVFGGSMIDNIASAISRYAGINPGICKSLLAYIAPLVLGKVAAQWRSQGGTTSALTSMFADQKRNIADAIPAGFSLADIPGWTGASETVRAAAPTHSNPTTRRAAEPVETTSSSLASWLLPLAVLLVGGLLLWNFLGRRGEDDRVATADKDAQTTTVMKPVVPNADQAARDTIAMPDMTRLTDDAKGVLTGFSDQLSAIRDAASAEAAAPKLEELNTKLDGLRAAWARLPEANRPAFRELFAAQMEPLQQKAQETLAIPSLSDRIKALINDILQKLTELATGRAPATPAATP